MSGAWKQRERLLAEWFGTLRNPLSGRNNRNDDGSKRLGDVLYRPAVLEAKRRKCVAPIRRAKETRKLADDAGLPWAHFEYETRTPEMCAIVVNFATARYLAAQLRALWEGKCQVGGAESTI